MKRPVPALALFILASSTFVLSADQAAPPALRLPEGVTPVRYEAELTIDPASPTFTGSVEIEIALKRETNLVWLNGTELAITSASARVGKTSVPAVAVPGGMDFVGFKFEKPLPAGTVRLHVEYTGKVDDKDTHGLFRQKETGDWYTFSQFEAIYARRAFPCFDEPAYKVPWQLSLHVRKNLVAVSNTPVLSETDEAGGMKKVVFAPTKPLPSYLIALGVGPFDIVPAGTAGKNAVPIRMIVPKGRGRDARWAVESTAPILDLLEKYFDIPYPYEKLDHLVIPQTVGFGAMENPGLVTYVSTAILYNPEDETVAFRRAYASVCAHETAHQWFGDLVTMAWWDDVWLNESFATWMAAKIMTRWQPTWNTALNRVASASSVMEADTHVTARRIRQPILSSGDIVNAFDGITYSKGSAVLGMFETWLGEEPFRRGVQKYIRTHLYGNATATDFLAAIAAESKNPAVPAAFSTFLDQPGVPLVTAGLECRAGTARLVLSQKRFLPVGSSGSAAQTWQVPVCARAGEPTADAVCTLLTAEAGELALPGTRCPDRVLLNPGSTGYYRTFYKGGIRAKLLADAGSHVNPADRVGILLDMAALAQSGDVPMASALALVPRFAGDADRHVVAATVRIAASAKDGLVPSELRANYGRFLEDTFGERARTLGFRSRPGEDDETKLLRTNLVGLVAENADDKVLGPEAGALARKWLKDRSAVEPEMMGIVLAAAARNGDAELFSAFRAEAMKTSDRRERRALLGALGSFLDPVLALEALRLTLSTDFDARESIAILRSEAGRPETRALAWSFFQVRYDVLVARLPRDYAAGFPGFFSGFSDAARRAEFEVFFKDRAPKAMGGDRRLAQALEAIKLHEALRAAQGESVSEFLAAYPASATLDLRPSTGR